MNLIEKIKILSDSAKYDVSCSSSGSDRKNKKGGIGNAAPAGICHSWTPDGRCISLLKVLFTNSCIYDCKYCINRSSNDVPRASFTPDELASLTINFYRRNYIEGLFLSSAICQSPDYTMEQLLKSVKRLREEENFNGYIHIKAIPGASNALIEETGKYVDRMSVNIELPSNESLKLLAPQKTKESIIKPMGFIKSGIIQNQEEKQRFKSAPKFVPGGQSTQLIIGATKDNDLKILKLSESLYHSYELKRVYYSAYIPVSKHPSLPAISMPPLLREHRLYQADWLLRFYGFNSGELLNERNPNFDELLDPKSDWALRNLDKFPVEVNKADYFMLLRVPGIGVKSAQRILQARRVSVLGFDDLKKLGIVLKRAKYFITCKGKYFPQRSIPTNSVSIRRNILSEDNIKIHENVEQLSFFTLFPGIMAAKENISRITGEL
ncbi:putative DNA modification/repair radical SAM protein [Lutispora saccharofermentans]|uniref:DNA modification/repair radical SAM protein n=1 Tax=Lutispora saccharofermentans TaxID=3024236 RepID=A0ABT1NDK1_9FIRM|nr:putative DNA modification/repair radical SAM protein [Lutispora saccharofermentans]MCQ1528426.1 putative DNA modification/repair radical SAM protein [Lutispora saccharofermentans]